MLPAVDYEYALSLSEHGIWAFYTMVRLCDFSFVLNLTAILFGILWLFQGTMEEKIYDRQVTKETLSQRVIDEHQIDRHFTAADLRELYVFKPDRLDDPDAAKRPIPSVPKVFSSCTVHTLKQIT